MVTIRRLAAARRRLGERYVRDAERRVAAPDARYPLSAGQHILHLLLTVLTGGLWAPVWVVRAWRGNMPYVPPAP